MITIKKELSLLDASDLESHQLRILALFVMWQKCQALKWSIGNILNFMKLNTFYIFKFLSVPQICISFH